MKKIIVFDEFNEIDLKPSGLMHKYIELTEKDTAGFFLKDGQLSDSSCPGCSGDNCVSSFSKFGLRYVQCVRCSTLFISPRPDDISLYKYFSQSSARKFWHDELTKNTKKKRREKIIKPRIDWIMGSTEEYLPGARHIVDINTNQYGYIEELIDTKFFERKTFINPFISPGIIANSPNIDVISNPMWDFPLKEDVDVVTIFEVADHTADVDLLFKKIHGMLKKDGLCFMTAILISGFDLQSLWDKAENLFPPDRLNVFSVEGLNSLFERYNIECVEFSTPGVLDVEITANAIEHNPQLKVSRFTEYLLKNRSEDIKKAFQEFLQESLLSSYGRILIRKK